MNKLIWIVAILVFCIGCGGVREAVTDTVQEKVVGEVLDRTVGEGTLATVEAAAENMQEAIATQEVVYDSNEDGKTTQEEIEDVIQGPGSSPVNPLDLILGETVADSARMGTFGRHYRASVSAGAIINLMLKNNGDADILFATQRLPSSVELPESIAGGETLTETFIVGQDSDLVFSMVTILANSDFEIMVSATGQNDAGSGGDAGIEDEPTTIESGTGYTGQFGSGDREDAFRLRVPALNYVELTVTNGEDSVDPIEYAVRTTADAYENSSAILPGSSATILIGEKEEYFATVIIFGQKSGGTYTLDMTSAAENDAGTGDDISDIPANAHAIQFGQMIAGTSLAGDADCYLVTLSEGMALSAEIHAPADQPNESRAAVEVRNDAGFVTSDTAYFAETKVVEYGIESSETVAAGDYTFCVNGGGAYRYTEYELTINEVTPEQ